MTDKKSEKQEPERVSIVEAHEIRFWCRKFGCTQQALSEAVDAVGHGPKAVEAYLAKQ